MSAMRSQRYVKLSLLYTCLNEVTTFFTITIKRFDIWSPKFLCGCTMDVKLCPPRNTMIFALSWHIERFIQHNFLLLKVASPSQCASLWRDLQHAHVRWLCWQIFRTFKAWNTPWHPASRVAKFIQNVTNKFIFHLTQSFWPATQGASYNLAKSPTTKSLTSILQQFRSVPATQLSEVWFKTWKRFHSDGKCPQDGTWCQRNNCQSSYKGEIIPEETDR